VNVSLVMFGYDVLIAWWYGVLIAWFLASLVDSVPYD
jgi:hypothetical protein